VEYPNVVAGLPDQVAQVTAGGNHSCARLVNGETWCWGINAYGQLGDGTALGTAPVGSTVAPVKVLDAPVFATISAGFEHTCGVTAAGVAWCWGSNTDGQSGFSNATADKCAYQSTYYPSTWVNCAATPREVQTPVTFAGIGGGSLSTCAWTTGGTGYCWGRTHGSFTYPGYGNNHVPRTPTSQPSWKFLTAATEFQCGIDAADMVQCFGDTQHGQTGTGISLPTLTVATPTAVTVPDSWTSVDGGSQHACGVRAVGTVVSCWGRNDHGQLGRVTPAGFSATPVTASF
jgi:alpha-tubulin suppressor-like RCC1 family protein